jgi:NitT/TauT family transport system permease protein
LSVGRDFGAMDDIIATMIVIFVIGIVFDRVLFAKVEERVRSRWGLDQHSG